MQFVLDPPRGVGDLRLGATPEALAEVLRRYGDVAPFRRTPDDTPGWHVRTGVTTFFVYCDANGCAEALEFARPNDPVSDRVTYTRIDLFADPAWSVVERLRKAGVELTSAERGHTYQARRLALSLWRDGGPDGPDGLPLHWKAVLIARPGYYD